MVIVALGFYNELDKIEFNNILKKFFPVNLEYDYKPYNIESEIVLDLIKEEYKLFDIGVLNTDNETPPFFSGPLYGKLKSILIHYMIKKMNLIQNLFFLK